ncbi:MAG TPA: hypothetical protein VI136_15660 [Verrucomicrobiae bacterium]
MFLYEYFRSSQRLRTLVVACRKLSRPLIEEDPADYRLITAQLRSRLLLLPEVQQDRGLVPVIEAWMKDDETAMFVGNFVNCRPFPETPALILRDQRWLSILGQSSAVWQCSSVLKAAGVAEIVALSFGPPGVVYRFEGSYSAKPYESVFPLVVDWRKNNRQILRDFDAEVLGKRPKEFAEFAKGRAKQTPFFTQPGVLPFRPRSALDWLGVWRRRQEVNTWREYWRLYCPPKYERTDEVARQADCRKVGLIFNWLETGTPLDPAKFK